MGCVDKAANRGASPLVESRRLFAEPMNSAVHICIGADVAVVHCRKHLFGMLRGGTVVKINQRSLSMNRLIENWKIFTNLNWIKCFFLFCFTGFLVFFIGVPVCGRRLSKGIDD